MSNSVKVVCSQCGRMCYSRQTGICKTCQGKDKAPWRGYVCECGNPKDFASQYCRACHQRRRNITPWSDDDIAFLREHYPTHGALWCAERLGRPYKSVRDRANRLHLCLTKETTRALVHNAAAAYMREHNPSHLPGARERMAESSRSRPDVVAKMIEGHARMMSTLPDGDRAGLSASSQATVHCG